MICLIKTIKMTLPTAKISRNKTDEKTTNLRLMELWFFRETGIENRFLYAILSLPILFENRNNPLHILQNAARQICDKIEEFQDYKENY